MGKTIRLDKFLTEMQKGTRSQVKEAAKKGRILVNGEPETRTERKIDPDADQVVFDGQEVSYRQYEYYMMNKPQGVVSARSDNLYQTVLDLMSGTARDDLSPVGRLDLDTEGLLLLTNDGDLAHRLLSPKKHVDKQYYVKLEGALPPDAVRQMKEGMTLSDGTPVQSADLVIMETGPVTEALLTIREGKFHQVKRMFQVLGCQVTYLKRLSMGTLSLDEGLLPGQYRPLTDKELADLGRNEH